MIAIFVAGRTIWKGKNCT